MTSQRRLRPGWLAIVMLILLSCNLGKNTAATPINEQGPLYTAAALTVEAAYTQTAAQSAPISTPTVTSAPEGTNQSKERCNQIKFISDVTIPDGTRMTPGNEFIKTWQLQNSGSCAWKSGYALIFDHGDQMDGNQEVQFTSGEVRLGESVEISVRLTAPDDEGTYQGHWKLRSDTGEIFGLGDEAETAFWVEIRVTTMGTGDPNEGVLLVSGSMEFGSVVATGDFDEGIFAPEYENGDISLNPTSKKLEPKNGALLYLWGASPPTFSDCTQAALSSSTISVSTNLVGKYICYRTNLGRPGMLYITQYNGSTFVFDFVTWKKP